MVGSCDAIKARRVSKKEGMARTQSKQRAVGTES
jgi:hypothetical protein